MAPEPPSRALPLLPACLAFSLRDIAELWLDTGFRRIAAVHTQPGLAWVSQCNAGTYLGKQSES
jgi:hypothetical protein